MLVMMMTISVIHLHALGFIDTFIPVNTNPEEYPVRRSTYVEDVFTDTGNPSGYGAKKLSFYENRAVSGISLLRACVLV